ncbi:hypothetical protein GCM10011390_15290 [Aureimonas endophytica]|uniref:DUF1127 domain-containing protein n=1 Tax=Aureimonas endophytica TaxID=2027858 RepID=A0A916ZH11_9HYPH|nr:DUF1127 domain-containing protein [Aureimonas endophytica]GGD97418.1 hypothetical protein GCM10011390_15290 [Aureimonas endophytica]
MSLFPRTFADEVLSGLPRPDLRLAAAALGAMVRTFRNRRAADRVADLPDYLLTDIGLKRDDVHEALSLHWREDPTFRLALRAAERRRGR